MSKFTVNNRLIVEPYKTDKMIRSNLVGGFAFMDQKATLHGLKLLVDFPMTGQTVSIGDISGPRVVPAGSTVYIREEILHTAAWVKAVMQCPAVDGPFMLVNLEYVEMIDEVE